MEEWKDIEGYEGLYQISEFGRVKSLARKSWNGYKYIEQPEIIREINLDSKGYPCLQLHKDGDAKMFRLHILLYSHFKGEIPEGYKVDHDDGDKENYELSNLELLTNRMNVSKGFENKKTSSKYTGVHWHKRSKRWHAGIKINGKRVHLGSFVDELDAHKAYQEKLKTLNN